MGYRRDRGKTGHTRRWRKFVDLNRPLLATLGVPEQLLEDETAFEYFLMHGDHPDAAFRIDPATLSGSRRALVERLVLRWYRAQLPDPGIVLLPTDVMDRLRAAARDPEASLELELALGLLPGLRSQARTLLKGYEGNDAPRVRLAIMTLARDDLSSIEELLAHAAVDYRDVLMWSCE
jgi:hypothetical protein